MAIKLNKKQTKQNKKETKQQQDVLSRLKKLKDATIEIDLKDLEWQDTSNPATKYYGTRFELEGIRVRIQIFIK